MTVKLLAKDKLSSLDRKFCLNAIIAGIMHAATKSMLESRCQWLLRFTRVRAALHLLDRRLLQKDGTPTRITMSHHTQLQRRFLRSVYRQTKGLPTTGLCGEIERCITAITRFKHFILCETYGQSTAIETLIQTRFFTETSFAHVPSRSLRATCTAFSTGPLRRSATSTSSSTRRRITRRTSSITT